MREAARRWSRNGSTGCVRACISGKASPPSAKSGARITPEACQGGVRRPLERLEPGASAAFDAGGDQPVDIEAVPHQLEDAQFFLACLAIGGGGIPGGGVNGFPPNCRQRLFDST